MLDQWNGQWEPSKKIEKFMSREKLIQEKRQNFNVILKQENFTSRVFYITEARQGNEKDKDNSVNPSQCRNLFGDLMWPVIFMLKLCGHNPLTYSVTDLKSLTANENGWKSANRSTSHRNFSVQYNSYVLIWTVYVAAVTIFDWVVFAFENATGTNPISQKFGTDFFQIILGRRFHEKSSPWIIVLRIALVITPITHIASLILAWKESSLMATFLNDWVALQAEFGAIFRHTSVTDDDVQILRRKRNYFLIFYVALPTLAISPVAIMLGINSTILVQFLIILPYAVNITAVCLLEDVKIIMTYWNIAAVFNQTHAAIKHVGKLELENLTTSKIQEWQKLIHSVRHHVNLACAWQKNHQLLWIVGSILQITCYVFIELAIPLQTLETQILGILLGAMSLLTAGRLYLKIIAASSITQKENLIAEEMILLNTRVKDYAVRSEIKFLHDMISQSPSVISFGNYVNLNQRLILGVASQVVTYIIVLMQFNQSKI